MATTEHSNGVNGTAVKESKVISPTRLAHVVLRTNKFDAMSKFYVTFLGGRVVHHNPMIMFMTYDDEHHRIALINMPHLQDKVTQSSGLEHIAFTFANISDLFESYSQRKALGIEPVWCTNHGITTSLYYKDPDGNMLETQFDNFEDNDEATAFMEGPDFTANPIGVDFDPEEMIKRIKSGEPLESLVKRRVIGVRGVDSVPGSG